MKVPQFAFRQFSRYVLVTGQAEDNVTLPKRAQIRTASELNRRQPGKSIHDTGVQPFNRGINVDIAYHSIGTLVRSRVLHRPERVVELLQGHVITDERNATGRDWPGWI